MTPEERARQIVDYTVFDEDDTKDQAMRDLLAPDIAAAIRAAVAEEREACAKVADKIADESRRQLAADKLADLEAFEIMDDAKIGAAGEIAAAIRARA